MDVHEAYLTIKEMWDIHTPMSKMNTSEKFFLYKMNEVILDLQKSLLLLQMKLNEGEDIDLLGKDSAEFGRMLACMLKFAEITELDLHYHSMLKRQEPILFLTTIFAHYSYELIELYEEANRIDEMRREDFQDTVLRLFLEIENIFEIRKEEIPWDLAVIMMRHDLKKTG